MENETLSCLSLLKNRIRRRIESRNGPYYTPELSAYELCLEYIQSIEESIEECGCVDCEDIVKKLYRDLEIGVKDEM